MADHVIAGEHGCVNVSRTTNYLRSLTSALRVHQSRRTWRESLLIAPCVHTSWLITLPGPVNLNSTLLVCATLCGGKGLGPGRQRVD